MSAPASPLSPSAADAYTIRPLTAADIPAVRELHTTLLHLPRPLPLTFFHQTLFHPSRICLIAVPSPSPSSSPTAQNQEPLAFITAALQRPTTDLARAPAPELHILTLGVRPALRRRGLATRLVRAAAAALQPARVPAWGSALKGTTDSALSDAAGSALEGAAGSDSEADSESESDSEASLKSVRVRVAAQYAANDALAAAFWEGVGVGVGSAAGYGKEAAGLWRVGSVRVEGCLAV
ncbi:hypothetical protein DENSPDRAFT_839380 [Dentipellis sp. KUC8613]|nr:hypothetical protein DENSPDRAFT_839380 [Dentipellis sp. KUC8613]